MGSYSSSLFSFLKDSICLSNVLLGDFSLFLCLILSLLADLVLSLTDLLSLGSSAMIAVGDISREFIIRALRFSILLSISSSLIVVTLFLPPIGSSVQTSTLIATSFVGISL